MFDVRQRWTEWGAVFITLAALSAAGCDRQPDRTALDVKRDYATRISEGMEFGLSGTIRAGRVDPATYELFDVRLEDADRRILHADRAEVIVNPNANTVMLRLFGVVSADSETGQLTEIAGLSTDEVKLGFNVRP